MKNARARRALFHQRKRALAMHILRGDPIDVRTGDADVGQFAVAEMRKLAPDVAIPLPGMEEACDR
jgi:hypothetical protein